MRGAPNGTDGDAPTGLRDSANCASPRLPDSNGRNGSVVERQAYPRLYSFGDQYSKAAQFRSSFEARNHQLHTFDHVLLRRVHDALKGEKRSNEDEKLGMNRGFSRRDFLNEWHWRPAPLAPTAILMGRARGPGLSDAESYPPARLGMRGSHPGAFEVAHNLRDRRQLDLSGAEDTYETL